MFFKTVATMSGRMTTGMMNSVGLLEPEPLGVHEQRDPHPGTTWMATLLKAQNRLYRISRTK
jgi:hypothetical protein